MLAGLGWGEADAELVRSALEPHVPLPGGHHGYRVVDEARIRPRLSDLGVDDPADLDTALAAWHRVATREWAYETWLAVESLQPIRLRLDAVRKRLAARGRRITLEDTWKLVNAPVDEDGLEILSTLALAIAGDRVARPHLSFLLDTARLRGASLEDAEQAGREASILRWFGLQYPGVGGVTIERAAALEEAAAERVVARLRLEIESPTIGRCRSCGRSCPPWFPLCDRCVGRDARSRRSRYEHAVTPDELRAVPLFAGVSPAGLERLAATGAEVSCEPGQVLVVPGDAGSGMYVVLDGTVRVEMRGGLHVELGKGNFFGEAALLAPSAVRGARVRAATAARCLSIPRDDFLVLVESEPSLALEMLRELARRMADTSLDD